LKNIERHVGAQRECGPRCPRATGLRGAWRGDAAPAARALSARGPQSIKRLVVGSAVTRQAVTKHLRVLAGAGLVHDVRRGREHIWELDPDGLDPARRWLDRISLRKTLVESSVRVPVCAMIAAR
jgi:DNA-binding transcriptional ArsR family regulator